MDQWGSGYVVDIPYTDGFYAEQAPKHLALTAAVNGFEPPDLDRAFTYCDLGCGRGSTALMLAAANPDGEFHGIDFNPAHIAHAAGHARAANLDNIKWHERSFADLTNKSLPSLPAFDIVAMHGVWSWIAPELQDAIVRFLDAHLKPGGLVYVSYNAMPGWASIVPLQRIVKELSALWPGRSDRAVENAIKMLARLAEAKIIPPNLHEGVKRFTDRPLSSVYLAHEYLNEHWKPLYHSDVVHAFANAKLGYAGSTQLIRNFTNLGVNEEQRGLLAEVPIPELRDTLRDFCIGHWFHQDVYVRGARRMTEARREALLGAQTLALLQPSPGEIEISGPGGAWRPHPDAYRLFLDALTSRPHTVAELLTLPQLPQGHNVSPVELVGVLNGGWVAAPFKEASLDVRSRCERLNRLAEAAGETDVSQTVTVVAPSAGTGVRLQGGAFELYRALKRGEKPDAETLAKRFVKRCSDQGGHPIVDGKAIENEAEALPAAERDFVRKIERLVPIWSTLGLV